jgi:2-polyprenyl-3-methyl-5-hydroxy-6-metoxy-1,4-benzoquinol methylase
MQDLDWTPDRIKQYYNDEYQQTNSLVAGFVQTAREHFNERMQTIQPVFQQLSTLLNAGMNVLEVGCGAGELLSLIKPLVASCVGVEINRDFTEFIQSELGIEAHAGEIIQLDLGRKFDLIICVDSLDHMPDPLEVLLHMRGLLTENGSLWLSVPNLNEALNFFLPEPNLSRYREFFWHRAHYFYFNTETITAMLNAAAMDVTISFYHQYTFKNYLNWYFTGKPQRSYVEGARDSSLLPGTDPFAEDLNSLLAEIEPRFHDILRRHGRGDTLWCHAGPRQPSASR